MALIKCPECGKKISDAAKNCVNCGFPITKIKVNKEEQNNKKYADKILSQVSELKEKNNFIDIKNAILDLIKKPKIKSVCANEDGYYEDGYYLIEDATIELVKLISDTECSVYEIEQLLLEILPDRYCFDGFGTILDWVIHEICNIRTKKDRKYKDLFSFCSTEDYYIFLILMRIKASDKNYFFDIKNEFTDLKEYFKIKDDINKKKYHYGIKDSIHEDRPTLFYDDTKITSDEAEKIFYMFFGKFDSYRFTAQAVLSPYINKIKNMINEITIKDDNVIMTYSIIENAKILDLIKELHINELPEVINKEITIIPCGKSLIFIKYNLFVIVHLRLKSKSKAEMYRKCHGFDDSMDMDIIFTECGALGIKDTFSIKKENKTQNFSYYVPGMTLKGKQSSVVGRSIAGGIIGGPTGAVIGAASAMESNRKNSGDVIIPGKSYTSVSNYEERNLVINLKELNKKIMVNGNNLTEEELIEIIKKLKSTITIENIIKSDLLDTYFANSDKYVLDENAMKCITEENINKEKEMRKDQYWEKNKKKYLSLTTELDELKSKIDILNNEIQELEKNNEPIINTIIEKYSESIKELKEIKEYEDLKKEITTLENELKNLSFFKFKAKHMLENELEQKHNISRQLEASIKKLTEEIENNKTNEINSINKEKDKKLQELESYKAEIMEIEDELNKDRL